MKPINFTVNAAKKVFQLMTEEENLDLKLRAYVIGGGCSGFQYGFTFDETQKADDTCIITEITEQNTTIGVTLLVDSVCFPLLKGATIDYKEDIHGAQFVIQNPNAKSTCGCGSSFSVD